MYFSTSDTIVAIATPPGRGGIGVVRLSGPDAVSIAHRLLAREEPLVARHATFVRIVDAARGGEPARTIDQAVVTWFAAPHSYTGEDVVEISGHGSPVLLQRIVEMGIAAGARLAEPGEFTLRAYLNERIDLAQAEAVADLVDAVTPLQARAAMDQLEGTLTTAIAAIDAALFDLSARLEASLDFADEGYHFVTREDAAIELARIRGELDALARAGDVGRVIREGRIVVIAGAPNAGKSSLFNAFVGSARAIVTPLPGTTRDLLTEQVDVEGIAVTLVDTAGLRDTVDVIETEGVGRARQAQDVAALRIVVLDGRDPDLGAHRRMLADTGRPYIAVVSKSDEPRIWRAADLDGAAADAIDISVVSGEGLIELRKRMTAALTAREELRDPPAISNVRHLALVKDAAERVGRALDALAAGTTEELILVDLGAARRSLEAITGRRTADDLLHHIFARFCIGK
jgi:tRNA modification GTPase